MASERNKELIKRILVEELTNDSPEQACLHTINHCSGALSTLLFKDRHGPNFIRNYMDEVVPNYSILEFRQHFRMEPVMIETLCEELAPLLVTERTLPVYKKVLSSLWVLSNQESYRGVADRFGLNKGHLHHIVKDVCHALTTLGPKYIKWPDNHNLTKIADDWYQKAGFPGVVGAIDGTYIPICGPGRETRDPYICRKGFPAMHLQVVCDKHLKFMHVHTGNAGSMHDARVFKNCDLKTLLESEEGSLPPNFHLLGDSAYPLSKYMMTPFRDDGHLSDVQKKYNVCHSRTRVSVEHSIGLLKGKFRRLKHLDMTHIVEIPYVIFAACVLHNFLLLSSDSSDEENVECEANDEVPDDNNFVGIEDRQGNEKRADLANLLYR